MDAELGRIAVLAHGHPSLTKGGCEVAAYSLFKGLKAIGLDPIFLATCPLEKRTSLHLDNNDEHAIFYDPTDYSLFYQISNHAITEAVLKVLHANQCRIANFQHFLNYGLNSVKAVAENNIGTVLTLHEYSSICHHYGQMVTKPELQLCTKAEPSKCHRCFPEFFPQQFEQRLRSTAEVFNAVQRFVSPSHFLAKRFAEWGIPHDKISIIENGLAPHAAHVGRSPRADARAPWVFGYFGQVNPFKGVDLLLEVAESLQLENAHPPIVIRIHGNMVGQSDEFRARFEKLRENRAIDYFGPYENGEVINLMSQCDYIVVPSIWWENSPMVIQEAYAAKRPLIASGIGGIAEKVIDGVTGLHFQVGSETDLKRAVLAAIDPAVADRLRTNLPEPLDQVAMAKSYLTLFKSLV